MHPKVIPFVCVQFSIAGCRPDMGKWAALVSAAHSARFSISGRHSAIENGTFSNSSWREKSNSRPAKQHHAHRPTFALLEYDPGRLLPILLRIVGDVRAHVHAREELRGRGEHDVRVVVTRRTVKP